MKLSLPQKSKADNVMLERCITIPNAITTARHSTLISQLDDKSFTFSSIEFKPTQMILPAPGRITLAQIGSKSDTISIVFCIKSVIYIGTFDSKEGSLLTNHDSRALLDLEGQSAVHVDLNTRDTAISVCSEKTVFVIDLDDKSTTILTGHHNTVTMSRFLLHEPDNVISISEDRTFKSMLCSFSNI
jgi:hypothetical protein